MRAILKQASWLIFAQAAGRVVSFFYAIFLARNLGVSDFGLYSTALAYFSLVSTLSDFGFNRYLITKASRDPLQIPKLLTSINLLRLTGTAILFAFFSLILYFLDPDKLRVSMILLAILAVIPQALAMTFDAVFIAIKKLQYSSLGFIILSLSTAVFGVFLINSNLGPRGAITAILLGQIIYFLTLVLIYKGAKLKFALDITLKNLKEVLISSLPYGLIGILGLLYFRVDTLLLTYMKGSFDVGIYGAGYKFLEAVVFVPSAVSAALFPNAVKLIVADPNKVYRFYIRITFLLFCISLVISIIYFFLLPSIIVTFLPKFLASIDVVRILALTIPFMFMISPQGIIMLAQKEFLKPLIMISVLNLIINISLNLYLIPEHSYLGSAWATVVSDIFGFLMFFFYIKSKLHPR